MDLLTASPCFIISLPYSPVLVKWCGVPVWTFRSREMPWRNSSGEESCFSCLDYQFPCAKFMTRLHKSCIMIVSTLVTRKQSSTSISVNFSTIRWIKLELLRARSSDNCCQESRVEAHASSYRNSRIWVELGQLQDQLPETLPSS